MSQALEVRIEQIGPSTAKGLARSHTVLIDRPVAKGGADQGPLGGELLLLALGGCFMSNLLAAIRAREAAISDVRIAVTGTIDGPPDRFTGLALKISARHEDSALMGKLVTIAERACIVTNTLREATPISIAVEDSQIQSAAQP
jgi:putative redox protein